MTEHEANPRRAPLAHAPSRRPTPRSDYPRQRGFLEQLARVIIPALLGAALLFAASAGISHPKAGLDLASERRALTLTARDGGSMPLSTPRELWTQGAMPHLFQTDPLWAQQPYAGGTVAHNGCGPTCLSMVAIMLTGNRDLTPAYLCKLADQGNYAPTGATEWRFMDEVPEVLGFSSEEIPVSAEGIGERLRQGAPVICSVEPGDFTAVGHFIVLSAIDDRGRVRIHDPNSSYLSAQAWDLKSIVRQTAACWSFA